MAELMLVLAAHRGLSMLYFYVKWQIASLDDSVQAAARKWVCAFMLRAVR